MQVVNLREYHPQAALLSRHVGAPLQMFGIEPKPLFHRLPFFSQ